MPTLTLKLSPAPPDDVQRRLAQALTAVTTETLGKRAAVTALVFEPVPAERWWIGAEPPARPTAMLEIRITAGTNTAEQKAAFIAGAQAALQHHLAPETSLEEASYVVVHELPATDWGYGGRTQRSRQLERVPGL
jgi:4-oxalocrotonate tautomerase